MAEGKMSKRRTVEQERAKAAWDATKKVPDAERSEYKTRAKNLPAMIQMNGLGNAMAFLLSKPKKQAYKLAYQHISDWVVERVLGKKGDMMNLIREENMSTYRRATTEAIQYGIWLKRYVESWEDVEESNE